MPAACAAAGTICSAVIPGGSSVPVHPEIDLRHGADGFRQPARRQESGLGTAAVIVMDKSTDIVEGDRPAVAILQARELRPVHAVPRGHRLGVAGDGAHGRRATPRSAEIDTLLDVTYEIEGHTICALATARLGRYRG